MGNLYKGKDICVQDMGKRYQSCNDYMDSFLRVLVDRLGFDRVAYDPGFDLRIGHGENCIPLFDATDYLQNRLGRRNRRNVEAHVTLCIDGCKEAIDQAIEDEIQRERERLVEYVNSVGLDQAVSEMEDGSGKLLSQFPLLRKYRGRIWDPVMDELQSPQPNDNQQ